MNDPIASFGIMTHHDELTMLKTLQLVCQDFPKETIRVVELGIADGRTGFGIANFLASQKRSCIMVGVDDKSKFPYPGRVIHADTQEAAGHPLLEEITLLFIDADHSLQNTLADFQAYSTRVVQGGYIIQHDTSPLIRPLSTYQGFGPYDNQDNHVSCRKACQQLGLLDGTNEDFELIFDEYDPSFTSHSGMIVVKKL